MATTNTKQQGKTAGNNNTKTIIIIIALLIVCIGGGYFLYPAIKKASNKKPVAVVPVVTPVDTTRITPVEEPMPEHKVESSASVEKGFYLIVGSYHQKSNAERQVKKVSGTSLTVLYFEELGLYRVSAGKYDNIHKAYNNISHIKEIEGCSEAWVLENI